MPARFWESCVSLVGLHYNRFWRRFRNPHQPTQILTARKNPQNRLIHRRIREVGLAVTRRQGARSYGLRAALSLAKLYQSTNRRVEAYEVLDAALEGFSPTPEFPEIGEALQLRDALALQ